MSRRTLHLAVAAALVAVAPLRGSTAGAATTPAIAWQHTYSGWDRSSAPTIADVNGDGVPEIVHGHQDGWLRVLDARTGTNIAHWPQPARLDGVTASAIDSSPAVADLDKDGKVEIVVGVGSTWVPNQQGGVMVFNSDGSVRCRYRSLDAGNIWADTPGPDGYGDGVYSSPSIGDVDGDGYPDIVYGAFDLNIHVLDRKCRPLPGSPHIVHDSTWSSPALKDVDGDGRAEIFIGSDWFGSGFGDPASGGRFRRLDWESGTIVEKWVKQLNDVPHSSPAVGDVDGDGRLDVVVGGGDYFHREDGHRVWAWHADDGSPLPGWPVTTGGVTFSSPAIGDVNNDGRNEVVVGSRDGLVHVYRANGSLMWERHLRFDNRPGSQVNASPILADFDGDGGQDVGIGNDWGFFVYDGITGAEMYALGTWVSYEAAGAVGDFGSLGWMAVIEGFDTPNRKTRVSAYQLPAPRVAPAWPMHRHDARHTAVAGVGQDVTQVECHAPATGGSAGHGGTEAFSSGPPVDVSGVFDAAVPANVNGDGRCDVVLYGSGTKGDVLRLGAAGGSLKSGPSIDVSGVYDALVPGDFNGDGFGDVLFYGAGARGDVLRLGSRDGTLRAGPSVDVASSFDLAVPGDFNGDGCSDVLFYGRGAKGDVLRRGTRFGVFVNGPKVDVRATYDLAVPGDFDGDGRTDVLLYGVGGHGDVIRLGR